MDQHPVAHITGDEPVEPAHRLSHSSVIGANHLAQILRVEPRGQRRRADQVTEHHRELPALGQVRGIECGRDDRLNGWLACRRLYLQRSDRFQEPLAMAERHAQPLKVGFRQLRENLGIDVMLTERRLVILIQPLAPRIALMD